MCWKILKYKGVVKMSICDPHSCTGCMACYNVCPKNAIKMESDQYGILSPKIKEEFCIRL